MTVMGLRPESLMNMLEGAHCASYWAGSFYLAEMSMVNYYQRYISYRARLHELKNSPPCIINANTLE